MMASIMSSIGEFLKILQVAYSYPEESGVVAFRLLGLRIILSRVFTIWLNLGRLFLSFCQQSSIN